MIPHLNVGGCNLVSTDHCSAWTVIYHESSWLFSLGQQSKSSLSTMRTSLALDVPKYFIHNNYILISLNKYIFVSVFFSSSRPSERENTQNVGYPAEWLSQTLSIQRQGSRFIEGACCAVKPKAVINNLGTTPSVPPCSLLQRSTGRSNGWRSKHFTLSVFYSGLTG